MKRKELKVNFIYIIIYIVIIICLILLHYYLLLAFTTISYIPPLRYIFRKTIDYTIGDRQPAMFPLLLVYYIINFHLCHKIYMIFLCTVFFVLVINETLVNKTKLCSCYNITTVAYWINDKKNNIF